MRAKPMPEEPRCSYSFDGYRALSIYEKLAQRFDMPARAYKQRYASRNMQIIRLGNEIMTVNVGTTSAITIENQVDSGSRLDISIPRSQLSRIEDILRAK